MRKVVLVVVMVALGAWTAALVVWSATGPTPDLPYAARPANVPDDGFQWHTVRLPGGNSTPVGVIRAADGRGGERPAVLLVTGTEGLNLDYPQFAQELAAQGFDVAVGCWFRTEGPTGAGTAGIACPQAPPFKGVSGAAVADLDALVQGADRALGGPSTLALVGFSRGGGIAMLRADGAPNPVVSVSGMLEGTTAWGQLPSEVNVVERVRRAGAGAAAARRRRPVGAGAAVEAHGRRAGRRGCGRADHWYPDEGHGLAQVPEIRADILRRLAEWLPTTLSRSASRRGVG
ncbi:MAG: hypothetical protein U0W40_07360 [Acidimicrobiia bacterium]